MKVWQGFREATMPETPRRARMLMKFPPAAIGLAVAGFGLILAGAAIWVLFSGPTAANATTPTDFSAIPAGVSYDAPPLELKDTLGVAHAVSDYRGQMVLINLWATWCPPCTAEMPILQQFYERYRGDGFVVIAIDDGDPKPEVVEFVNAHHLTFPIWLDQTYQATDRAFKTTNLPSSYLVDRGGRIRLVWFGAISEANLEKYVAPLIKD